MAARAVVAVPRVAGVRTAVAVGVAEATGVVEAKVVEVRHRPDVAVAGAGVGAERRRLRPDHRRRSHPRT